MWPAVPASDYYGPSAPPPGYQQTACLPAATLEWAAVRGPGGGSHVHHRPVDGGGVQLFPCSIATSTPQAFTVASRKGLPHPARESPVASVPRACAAARPPIHQVGAGGPLEGVPPLVSALVHLPVSLAGPGPSGGAGPSRRCQSCSRPAPCLRGQAALSCKRTAATARRWVPSSHPVEWRLVAHEGVGSDLRRLVRLRQRVRPRLRRSVWRRMCFTTASSSECPSGSYHGLTLTAATARKSHPSEQRRRRARATREYARGFRHQMISYAWSATHTAATSASASATSAGTTRATGTSDPQATGATKVLL